MLRTTAKSQAVSRQSKADCWPLLLLHGCRCAVSVVTCSAVVDCIVGRPSADLPKSGLETRERLCCGSPQLAAVASYSDIVQQACNIPQTSLHELKRCWQLLLGASPNAHSVPEVWAHQPPATCSRGGHMPEDTKAEAVLLTPCPPDYTKARTCLSKSAAVVVALQDSWMMSRLGTARVCTCSASDGP